MAQERALSVVFPGQGSQSVGMLAALADAHPVVRETFEQASAVLGYDLWTVSQEGPEARLNETAVTQPALLSAGVAAWRVWREAGGPLPVAMAGHSLGEYTALVCAGALGFDDAVGLVAERGRLMQAAVPAGEGAMAAVLGLDDPTVETLCRDAAEGDVLAPANYNAPGQVVVAGTAAAVARLVAQAREAGAKRVVELPVSVPSHCALMGPAAEQLGGVLAEAALRSPTLPVVHNVDAQSHAEPDAIRQALQGQLDHPVRWVETVHALTELGAEAMVEAGPGKVLVGLSRRIERRLPVAEIQDPQSLRAALALAEEE